MNSQIKNSFKHAVISKTAGDCTFAPLLGGGIFKYYFVLLNNMENVSLKLEISMSKQIERNIKEFHYGTKTEYIREAIREKLKKNEEERKTKQAWQALFAARGIFKGKGKAKTDEEFRKLREEAGAEFMEMLEKRFSQK